MSKHTDKRRTELLARQDEIAADLRTVDGDDHYAINELHHEQEEIAQALAKLDELATTDDRPHPRLKVRRVPDHVTELDMPEGSRWLVSVRHDPADDVEQALGALPDMRAAHHAAREYVAVQRFLAERLGGTR